MLSPAIESPHRPAPAAGTITRVATDLVYANAYIEVFFDPVVFPNGAGGRYTRIRVGQHDGVAVLPVRDGKIGLVRQYRYPIGAFCWEIPRGFADSDDTAMEAERELAEETGATGVAMVALGALHPDTGILDSTVRLFLAELPDEATFAAVDEVDDAVWLPIGEVLAMIGDGTITDSFTVAAASRAHLRGLI